MHSGTTVEPIQWTPSRTILWRLHHRLRLRLAKARSHYFYDTAQGPKLLRIVAAP